MKRVTRSSNKEQQNLRQDNTTLSAALNGAIKNKSWDKAADYFRRLANNVALLDGKEP